MILQSTLLLEDPGGPREPRGPVKNYNTFVVLSGKYTSRNSSFKLTLHTSEKYENSSFALEIIYGSLFLE